MKTIRFDDGLVTYRVGQGQLRFNPADPALYTRFIEASKALEKIEPQDLQEADDAIRQVLQRVFPEGDLRAVFPGSLLAVCGNGKLLVVNFLEALEPILTEGAQRYAGCL